MLHLITYSLYADDLMVVYAAFQNSLIQVNANNAAYNKN
jgi:hypothetical protein